MIDTKLVIRLAILSRVSVIVLQALSNFVLPDHDANVFVSPKSANYNQSVCHSIVETTFGGFRRWDAEYFLHIAEHGYTYENTLVFYPLFPFCVRYITYIVQSVSGVDCEFRDISLLVAVILNVIFFTKAALVLHELTIEVFNNHRLARIVTTSFCFNPASIFFSAPYTESLFCWLSFSVMLHCSRNQIRAALLPLSLGLWCRSNGMLNFGFILYYVTRDIWAKGNRNAMHFLKGFLKVSLSAIVASLVFAAIQAYYYTLYCESNHIAMNDEVKNYGIMNNYLLAGERKAIWCSFTIPFSYSYLQSQYWNVGFMKYYEFKQIPNFVLALPILSMIILHSIRFILNNRAVVLTLGLAQTNTQSAKQFVYVIHALALSIFCLFFVHIQVSTRMLASSSPYIYWLCAQYFHEEHHQNSFKAFLEPQSRNTKLINVWFFGYFTVGTILFSNFLPWT